MAMEDAAGLTAARSGIWTLFTNHALISAFLGFAIAQALKFITFWYKEKQWDPKQLIGSGGMPSSHSATVTALAVGVGLQEGFGGSEFAIALVLACVLKQWALEKRGLPGHMVMYDATGVRLHAGRQAEVLNQILFELPAEHPLAESTPLRELLGHTPTQVAAGALLGSVTAIFINLI